MRALGGDLEERGHRRVVTAILDAGVDELALIVGRKRACEVFGRSRASHYRQRPVGLGVTDRNVAAAEAAHKL